MARKEYMKNIKITQEMRDYIKKEYDLKEEFIDNPNTHIEDQYKTLLIEESERLGKGDLHKEDLLNNGEELLKQFDLMNWKELNYDLHLVKLFWKADK